MSKQQKKNNSVRAQRKLEKKKRSDKERRKLVAARSASQQLDLSRGEWPVDLSKWDAQFSRGMTLLEAGRTHEAEREMRELLADSPIGSPVRAEACFGLGTVYTRLEEYEQAYLLFKEATELDGGRYDYWHNLAMACIHRLRPYEAEAAWLKCLQHNPDEEALRMVRSGLDVIEQAARTRILANPEVTHEALVTQERVFDAGLKALESNDAMLAVEHFRQCVAIDPMHCQSWGNLGMSLLKMNQLEEGEHALEQALKIDPEYQFARFNLESLRRLRESPNAEARGRLESR
jgi:Flp pilus assembly protein TadD